MVIHEYGNSNQIVFRPGNGTEFSSAFLCSVKKEEELKEELWEHKGKERVAPNFWFYCAWLCWGTVKTIYVLWAWQRVSPPLPFTPEVNKCPTSQIRMRDIITRAVLFSGTWVMFRRKTGLDNVFLLWVFKIRLTNTLNNRCTGRIWGSDQPKSVSYLKNPRTAKIGFWSVIITPESYCSISFIEPVSSLTIEGKLVPGS